MADRFLSLKFLISLTSIILSALSLKTLPSAGTFSIENLSVNASGAPRGPTFRDPYVLNFSSLWVHSDGLQERGLSCECFNPSQKCCVPGDKALPPFCIAGNSTCCANTYCNADESCCDDGFGLKGCCPGGSSCSQSGFGCCSDKAPCGPKNACIDYNSLSCFNETLNQFLCCPSDAPYCLNSTPYGYGCYASSSPASPSSFSFSQTDICRTESSSPTSTIILKLILINSSLATIVPVSSSIISTGLDFTLPTAAGGEPSTTEDVSSSTGSMTSGSTQSSSTVTPLLSSYVAPTPITTLCFNPTLETNLPCTPPPMTSNTSTSPSDDGYSPAGAKTLNSQAAHAQGTSFYSWYLFGTAFFVALIFLRAVGEVVSQLGGRRQRRENEGIGARRRRTMERRITERMEGEGMKWKLRV